MRKTATGGTKLGMAAALMVLMAAAGCSSIGGGDQSAAASGEASGGRRILNTLFAGNPNAEPPAAGPRPEDISCPRVEQRPGGAAYRVAGRDGDQATVRYQASFGPFARECANLGIEVGLRVGVAGQVVLGPVGQPGTYDVPVLITLLDDDGAVVIERSVRLSVSVPAGQTNAAFQHTEDLGSLPMPENRFAGYRFQVGFVQPGETRRGRR